LHRPTGFFLLFIPPMLSLALLEKLSFFNYYYYILLFLIGSVLMRGAGCIINDLCDYKYDMKISRTCHRPIASGSISFVGASIFLISLLLTSLLILLQFNFYTIISGFIILIFIALYPLMKRVTYYPQLFLGVTINFGVIMVSLALTENVSRETFLLYFATIFWTIIYDTIYAFQDIEDDIIIGVRSLAIRINSNPKLLINILFIIMSSILIFIGYDSKLGPLYFFFLLTSLLYYSSIIRSIDFTSKISCAQFFTRNIYFGFLLLISFIFS
jgi:4-hydroxybenzoate polyprenyl transferase